MPARVAVTKLDVSSKISYASGNYCAYFGIILTKLFNKVPSENLRVIAVKILVAGLSLAAALVLPVMTAGQNAAALATNDGIATVCISDDGCEVPYEFLSSEETDSYLVSGEAPVERADVRAAKRWPDVRSCLVREEHDAEVPDIRKFDWKRMRRPEDIEVCMFRIAASVGGPQEMKLWFVSQGMSQISAKKYQNNGKPFEYAEAFNFFDNSGRSYLATRSLISQFFRIQVMYNESFSAVWTDEGVIFSTNYETTTN